MSPSLGNELTNWNGTNISYDNNVNRRSTLTLSNGVNMSYTYDNDSRVTGMTYKFNNNTLGNLAYTYDELGRRTLVNGSFARTGMPAAVPSANYDAANELTNWNGTAIAYDNNGNMLSDGTNVFTWNARNQAATLNAVSLQYDGTGRRIKNAAGISFLYDADNAAQELSGTTVTANLLSGGIDEVFTRTDGSGSFTPLKDILGSTIAVVDSSGNVQTSYSYDPFGNTTISGAANSNEFQYTGRENEGNGLYYYRARYYNPAIGRFVNEDPLGFGGGDVDVYAYVRSNPINLIDPFGLDCRTYIFFTTCDTTGESPTLIAAEKAHEAQHRRDNGALLVNAGLIGLVSARIPRVCQWLESRGFAKEIPILEVRIKDLAGRYSRSREENKELQELNDELNVAKSIATDRLAQKVYCTR